VLRTCCYFIIRRLGHPSFSLLNRLYPVYLKRLRKINFFVMLVSWESIPEAHMLVLVIKALVFLSRYILMYGALVQQ
jgi:hypothetical protein